MVMSGVESGATGAVSSAGAKTASKGEGGRFVVPGSVVRTSGGILRDRPLRGGQRGHLHAMELRAPGRQCCRSCDGDCSKADPVRPAGGPGARQFPASSNSVSGWDSMLQGTVLWSADLERVLRIGGRLTSNLGGDLADSIGGIFGALRSRGFSDLSDAVFAANELDDSRIARVLRHLAGMGLGPYSVAELRSHMKALMGDQRYFTGLFGDWNHHDTPFCKYTWNGLTQLWECIHPQPECRVTRGICMNGAVFPDSNVHMKCFCSGGDVKSREKKTKEWWKEISERIYGPDDEEEGRRPARPAPRRRKRQGTSSWWDEWWDEVLVVAAVVVIVAVVIVLTKNPGAAVQAGKGTAKGARAALRYIKGGKNNAPKKIPPRIAG
jgi:hypothetical protein